MIVAVRRHFPPLSEFFFGFFFFLGLPLPKESPANRYVLGIDPLVNILRTRRISVEIWKSVPHVSRPHFEGIFLYKFLPG